MSARDRILEELLVLRVQEGSESAFEQLVASLDAPLARHVRRWVRDEDAMRDVIQETWIAVARGIRGLRDAAAFRVWLYRIATRKAVERHRRDGGESPTDPERLDARAAADPDRSGQGRAALLRAALLRLSSEQQALISLRYVEEFSVREIARVLGIPVGTVKSRLHHAREELRHLLENDER